MEGRPGQQDGAMVILVNREGHILLMHRDDRDGVLHRDKWSIVGGGVEAGETPEDAVRREVFEEIGVEVEPSYLLRVVDTEERGHRISVFVAALDRPAGGLRLGQGQEVRFFTPGQIAALRVPSFARAGLDRFYQRL